MRFELEEQVRIQLYPAWLLTFHMFLERFIYFFDFTMCMALEMDAGTATITSKNMIVIPKKAREKFNLQEGQKLKVFVAEHEIILAPLLSLDQLCGILKGPKSSKELIAEVRKNESRYG